MYVVRRQDLYRRGFRSVVRPMFTSALSLVIPHGCEGQNHHCCRSRDGLLCLLLVVFCTLVSHGRRLQKYMRPGYEEEHSSLLSALTFVAARSRLSSLLT